MLRILHFSDFHYKEKHSDDFKDLSLKLASSLQDMSIDFIVFSGDLVFEAKSQQIINEAADMLLNPILNKLNLPKDRLMIVPGNHDMIRTGEMKMVSESLNSKKSIEEIDDFCADEEQLDASLTRFTNYNAFIKDYYGTTAITTKLYTTFIREIKNKKYGWVGLNSAWRCIESTKDRGNLLYPVFLVRKAIESVRDCDFIFCSMHHNISDFKDFLAQDIEDIINEKCHVLFTGHYHKVGVSAVATSDVGLIHSVAPATYNRADKQSQYGYCILEIDEDSYEVKETPYFYQDGKFIEANTRCLTIPVSVEKKAINDFRRLMRKKLLQCRQSADKQFVYGKNGEDGYTFTTLFKEPIIKDKSLQEILTSKKEGNRILMCDILTSNKSAILFGHNKCGKTSLLYKFQIETLQTYTQTNIIPFFLKYEKYKRGLELDLKDEMRGYFEKSRKDLDKFIEDHTILLLIDDIDLNDDTFLTSLQLQLKAFKKIRFIASAEETMSKQCALINFEDDNIKKYYIHDITSKEVHQLTNSWPNISIENKKQVEEKIMQIFNQMHIPFNYWTTSLFLWIFEKTDESNIHNNFELVKLYIDEILDKKNFVLDRNISIEYDDLKSYLAGLAEHILKNNYHIDDHSLTTFTEEYRNNNKKFTMTTWDTISFLLDKAVITKINNKYTFRLKGVFEYFLAYRMKESNEFKEEVLNNYNFFLSFGNELELYAGFRKDDIETVKRVYKTIQEMLSPLTNSSDYNEIDTRLDDQIQITSSNLKITGELLNRLSGLSSEEQQELLPTSSIPIDDSIVKPKIGYPNIEANSGTMEKGLFILARVYRNSNVCNNEVLSNEILDYVITGSCNLGFLLVKNIGNVDLRETDDAKSLVQMVSNFMPIIIEAFLYDAISQKNLIRIFEEKLNELKANPNGNELRLFLIALILVDLDIKNNMHYLTDTLPFIKKKVLRYALINKMLLVIMKNSDNASLISPAKDIIKELQNEFKDYKRLDQVVEQEMKLKNMRDQAIKHINEKDYI
ncbi:metallophosphoesterase [uncultured Bacteroides sp.]|uniref:metallophosphoesterase n=1 Tax=uncultured Bacteroides sp. TaxID=162156 RepID=UPI0025955C4E|nr:metallophosphoesterase [uncultured Bacteroides sp.]